MSSQPKDGGPAFPTDRTREIFGVEFAGVKADTGMSLRDWFAGQALPSVMLIYCADNKAGIAAEHALANAPVHAYRWADAMLKARQQA